LTAARDGVGIPDGLDGAGAARAVNIFEPQAEDRVLNA
jgi:hypothetical protein